MKCSLGSMQMKKLQGGCKAAWRQESAEFRQPARAHPAQLLASACCAGSTANQRPGTTRERDHKRRGPAL
eukprot:5917082-Prymnesium_polylepis.1